MTDVTNASRTLLLNLKTLDWDPEMLDFFQIERHCLPTIKPCASLFGLVANGPLQGTPVTSVTCLAFNPQVVFLTLSLYSIF